MALSVVKMRSDNTHMCVVWNCNIQVSLYEPSPQICHKIKIVAIVGILCTERYWVNLCYDNVKKYTGEAYNM